MTKCRQRHSCRCAGGPTAKKWSPDRANRPGEGLLGTAPWLACIGRAKEGKKLKVCETGYMGEGQKTELYSFPPTASLVLQCSALISSSRSQTKKNFRHNRGQKSVFKGVGAGNLKKKKRTHHWMRIFRQSCTLHSPLSIEHPTIGQQ